MNGPREMPDWLRAEVQAQPLIVRSVDAVGIAMSVHDYNDLVLLLGIAAGCSSTPGVTETALRLMRAFNPRPPEAAP